MKLILIFFIILLLNNCSLIKILNIGQKMVLKRIEDQKKLSNVLKKSADITTMTYEEYKIYIDDFTKTSKYPDINQ